MVGLIIGNSYRESSLNKESKKFEYNYMLDLQGDSIVIEDRNHVQYTIAPENLEEFIAIDNL